MRNRKHLSTTTVARLLGVAVGSVAKWIDKDELRAGRTPGGHRRVTEGDLLEFLQRQKLPIPPELTGTPVRILIVEDEESVANWVAQEIRTEHPDFQVMQAHDGFAAGEIVGSWQPDVVVLDLRMPGMDGYEVCRRIKARQGVKDPVIIAMTAHHSPGAEDHIRECGAVACLPKPLDIRLLLQEIDSAVHQYR
jgi:excisionase family DNA binding protein